MNQELLYKYFKGTTTIEEEKRILDWVEASEENREAFLKERMMFDVALFSDRQSAGKKTFRLAPILKWGIRIAAVIIVGVCGYFMTNDYLYNQASLPLQSRLHHPVLRFFRHAQSWKHRSMWTVHSAIPVCRRQE